MLLGRHMQLFPPLPAPRDPRIRLVAITGSAVLIAASVSACTAAQQVTTGMKVHNAVTKLGEQSTATVTASVRGSTQQTYAFLSQAQDSPVTHEDAARLAHAELTLAAGSGEADKPLKDVPESDAVKVAASLNLGGTDFAAVKSVHDKLYLRTNLDELVRQAGGSQRARRRADHVMALANDLPAGLGSAGDALRGRWVEADPAEFDGFARAAERLAGRGAAEERTKRERSARAAGDTRGGVHTTSEDATHAGHAPQAGRHQSPEAARRRSLSAEQAHRVERELSALRTQRRRSRTFEDVARVGSSLNGQSQREFLQKVERLLRRHAKFTDQGEHAGADRVRLTLPSRESAEDLAGALRPLGARIDPGTVPSSDISAYLTIRRGQLTALALDLGQFTGGTSLPLHLDFSGGGAIPVSAPAGAKELKPQDLLAAAVYGALGTDRF
jgi:hypothetical protein